MAKAERIEDCKERRSEVHVVCFVQVRKGASEAEIKYTEEAAAAASAAQEVSRQLRDALEAAQAAADAASSTGDQWKRR